MFQAYNCHDNTIRAIKIISKCELSSKERKSILREINILKNLNHPHIIKIIEVIEDE